MKDLARCLVKEHVAAVMALIQLVATHHHHGQEVIVAAGRSLPCSLLAQLQVYRPLILLGCLLGGVILDHAPELLVLNFVFILALHLLQGTVVVDRAEVFLLLLALLALRAATQADRLLWEPPEGYSRLHRCVLARIANLASRLGGLGIRIAKDDRG